MIESAPRATGCVSELAVDGSQCEPDDPCVTDAKCDNGSCVGGQPVVCDDGPCDIRSCDQATGACEIVALAAEGAICGPATACAAAATCEQGSCVPGAAKCDDGDPCTADLCDPSTGACSADSVTCPLEMSICNEAVCSPSTGSCESVPVPLCTGGAILFEALMGCGDGGVMSPWVTDISAGDVGFAIDATPSNPPETLDDACSLNVNNGSSFAATGGQPTKASATSAPFLLGVATPAGAVVTVRFWQWWQTDLGDTTDRRYVGLVDADGVVLSEVELDKSQPEVWHPQEVPLPTGFAGPLRLRFRFDSVTAEDNDGAGWFLDRILVVAANAL